MRTETEKEGEHHRRSSAGSGDKISVVVLRHSTRYAVFQTIGRLAATTGSNQGRQPAAPAHIEVVEVSERLQVYLVLLRHSLPRELRCSLVDGRQGGYERWGERIRQHTVHVLVEHLTAEMASTQHGTARAERFEARFWTADEGVRRGRAWASAVCPCDVEMNVHRPADVIELVSRLQSIPAPGFLALGRTLSALFVATAVERDEQQRSLGAFRFGTCRGGSVEAARGSCVPTGQVGGPGERLEPGEPPRHVPTMRRDMWCSVIGPQSLW